MTAGGRGDRGQGLAGAARPSPYNRGVSRSWILTGSPEHHAATRDRDLTITGLSSEHDIALLSDRMAAAAGAGL